MGNCLVRQNAPADSSVTNGATGASQGRKGIFSCLTGVTSGASRARIFNPQAPSQARPKSMLSKLFPRCAWSPSSRNHTEQTGQTQNIWPNSGAIITEINQNRMASFGLPMRKPSKELQKILDLVDHYQGIGTSTEPAVQMKALFNLIQACNSYLAVPHKTSGIFIENLKQRSYREVKSLCAPKPDEAGPSNDDHTHCLEGSKTIIGLMQELNSSSIPARHRAQINKELQGYDELLANLNQPDFADLAAKFESALKDLENNIEKFAKQTMDLCSNRGKTLHAFAKLHNQLHHVEIDNIFAQQTVDAEIQASQLNPAKPQDPNVYNIIKSHEFKYLMKRIDTLQENILNFKNHVIGPGRDAQFNRDVDNLLSFFKYVRAIALNCPDFVTDPMLQDLVVLEELTEENFLKAQSAADGGKIPSLFEGIKGFPMFNVQRNAQRLRIDETPTMPEQNLLATCLDAAMKKIEKLLGSHAVDIAQRRSLTDIRTIPTQKAELNSAEKMQICFYKQVARLKEIQDELNASLDSLSKKDTMDTSLSDLKSETVPANAASTMKEALAKLFEAYQVENDLSMINILKKIDQVVEDTISEIKVTNSVWKPARKIREKVLPKISTVSQVSKRVPFGDPPSGIKRSIEAAKKYTQKTFFTKLAMDFERIKRRKDISSMPKPEFNEWQYSFQNPDFGLSRPIAEIIYDKLAMIKTVVDDVGKEVLGNVNADIAKSRSKLLLAFQMIMKDEQPKSPDLLLDDDIARHANEMVRHASNEIKDAKNNSQKDEDIIQIMQNPKEYFGQLTFVADLAKNKMINDDYIKSLKFQLAQENLQAVETARIAHKMIMPNNDPDQGALENPWLQKILDARELDRLENPTRKTKKLIHLQANMLRFIPLIGEMVVVQKQFFDDHKLFPGMFSKIDIAHNAIFFGEQAYEAVEKK